MHKIIDRRTHDTYNGSDALAYAQTYGVLDDVPMVLVNDVRDDAVTLVLRPSFTRTARLSAVIAFEGWPEMAYGVETMYRDHVSDDDYAAAIASLAY